MRAVVTSGVADRVYRVAESTHTAACDSVYRWHVTACSQDCAHALDVVKRLPCVVRQEQSAWVMLHSIVAALCCYTTYTYIATYIATHYVAYRYIHRYIHCYILRSISLHYVYIHRYIHRYILRSTSLHITYMH